MLSDEEFESTWLYGVLDCIGVNNEYRVKSQRVYMMYEILQTYDQQYSKYVVGSRSEGLFTPDGLNDMDILMCDEDLPVIEDITEAGENRLSLLIVRESNTPPGYGKLQLVINGVPCTSTHWPIVSGVNIPIKFLKTDSLGRIVLFDIPALHDAFSGSRCMNKPSSKHGLIDIVQCYRCKTWPSIAQEWLFRQRLYGWPITDTIQEIKSFGYFVVKKGHPLSTDKYLEWRISLSLQERKIMFSLTDVQYKCYYALKMFNRHVIKLDYITSYHWKTCLFYVIEENNQNIWQMTRLVQCVELCIEQMLKWVNSGFCPNYFIPRDNLFDGKLNASRQLILENILKQRLDSGFMLDIKSFSLFSESLKLLESYNYLHWFETRKKVHKKIMFNINGSMIMFSGSAFNINLLDHDYRQSNTNITNFIYILWERLYIIRRVHTITEHTAEETKSSLSLLTPFIYENIASNISSMAILHPNQQVRYFLLLGSLYSLIKGDLSARLKFISVLYAIGLYEDCQFFLEREDEHYIKKSPSVCICRLLYNNPIKMDENDINDSNLKVYTCILFLPTELPITPDAMKYEMFRYFGIWSKENERTSRNYRASVDCNIYFFLLKYLIKRKLRRDRESEDAKCSIISLLLGTNVIHRDVACNVLTWMFCSDCLIPHALFTLALSWRIMNNSDLYLSAVTEEMKLEQFPYNAAKLHALVLLYNTWFARKVSSVHFCYQCFSYSKVKLQKCSRCKISSYCSKQCQRKNWKIHKAVCKIVRSVNIVCLV